VNATVGTRDGFLLRPSRAAVPASDVAATLKAVADAAQELCLTSLSAIDPVAAVSDTIDAVAKALATSPWDIAGDVLDRALSEPLLAQMPPELAFQTIVVLVGGATVAEDAALWMREPSTGLRRIASTSSEPEAADEGAKLADVALEAPDGVTIADDGRTFAMTVRRFGVAVGALVVRVADSDPPDAVRDILTRAVARIAPTLERLGLLESNEARERSIVEAAEKRLVRVGYDLHDGPLQAVAALGAGTRYVASDVEHLVPEEARAAVRESFQSLVEQIANVEQGIRAIAQSSEASFAMREPLAFALQRELNTLRRLSPISVDAHLAEDLPDLTDSQRVALYRVAQEALTNVRDHSGASSVSVTLERAGGCVRLTIVDDGRGFDVDAAIAAALRRGRLGLAGISERIRLLGGALKLTSAPGQGTRVEVALAPWSPPAAQA
jgi:signal transduction histidine kinase